MPKMGLRDIPYDRRALNETTPTLPWWHFFGSIFDREQRVLEEGAKKLLVAYSRKKDRVSNSCQNSRPFTEEDTPGAERTQDMNPQENQESSERANESSTYSIEFNSNCIAR